MDDIPAKYVQRMVPSNGSGEHDEEKSPRKTSEMNRETIHGIVTILRAQWSPGIAAHIGHAPGQYSCRNIIIRHERLEGQAMPLRFVRAMNLRAIRHPDGGPGGR